MTAADAAVLHLARQDGTLLERGSCTRCGARCSAQSVFCSSECQRRHLAWLAWLAWQPRAQG